MQKISRMKRAAAVGLMLFLFQGSLSTVRADDELVVSNIRAMVTEKGSSVYALSVFAAVTNHGPSRTVVIELIALNSEGFQIGNAVLSGSVEQGQRRMLSSVIQMQKEDVENIDHWEWRKP
jgi:hypothetical protein